MKRIKITYWTATSIVAIMMTYSAYAYLTDPAIKNGFYHLGFPDYFRVELALAKFIGVIILIAPFTARIKEWAYAGFTITFISAFIAHTFSGDPATARIGPVIFIVLLLISYITYHKQQNTNSIHTLEQTFQT